MRSPEILINLLELLDLDADGFFVDGNYRRFLGRTWDAPHNPREKISSGYNARELLTCAHVPEPRLFCHVVWIVLSTCLETRSGNPILASATGILRRDNAWSPIDDHVEFEYFYYQKTAYQNQSGGCSCSLHSGRVYISNIFASTAAARPGSRKSPVQIYWPRAEANFMGGIASCQGGYFPRLQRLREI